LYRDKRFNNVAQAQRSAGFSLKELKILFRMNKPADFPRIEQIVSCTFPRLVLTVKQIILVEPNPADEEN
jgi:hypothetical protein